MQAYLREVNKDKKVSRGHSTHLLAHLCPKPNALIQVIEYCFFQPGSFMEYAAWPIQRSKHVPPMPLTWQLDDLRIVAVRGHEDDPITLTTVGDIAGVVRLAIEYEGAWPEVGGINGSQTSIRQLQKAVEKIRGKSGPARVTIDADHVLSRQASKGRLRGAIGR